MFENVYYEEYEVGATRETVGRTITETDIVMHAGQTGDFFPHHMDAEWCKKNDFGERIAHGTLTFSVAAGMLADKVNLVAFSYGYEKVRFIKPVFINDTIRVRSTIKEKKDSPKHQNYGIANELVEVFNQNDDLVMVCEHLYMVEKKDQ